MSKESYARGFCKAAAAAGVDPVALAKYAEKAVLVDPKSKQHVEYDKGHAKGASGSSEREAWEPFVAAAKKTKTNPTIESLYSLGAMSPKVLKPWLRGKDVSDYLTSMYGINPEAATAAISGIREVGKEHAITNDLDDQEDRYLKMPYNMAITGNEDLKGVAKLNYATATNILDRMHREGGSPRFWDVENARATPEGLGLVYTPPPGKETPRGLADAIHVKKSK